MLARLKPKTKFDYYRRCLSDKPSNKNNEQILRTIMGSKEQEKHQKVDSIKAKEDGVTQIKQEQSENITLKPNMSKKVQDLLKGMTVKPKLSDSEYKEKFTTAQEKVTKSNSNYKINRIAKEDGVTQIKQEQSENITLKPNMSKKVQDLLKGMTVKPKLSDSEYEERFTTAQGKVAKSKPNYNINKIEEDITKAAVEVAKAIGGDSKLTETELLSKVLGKIDKSSTSLTDLLGVMKIQQTENDDTQNKSTRGEQVKRIVAQRTREKSYDRVERYPLRDTRYGRKSTPSVSVLDIYSGKPLNIFNKSAEIDYGTKLDVWDMLNDREVTLATTQAPRNYFEKMILWTEQGKVWQFPINNEQGMEEEENIPFTEHIFLDAHLEGWCPAKGAIRHFMELVCVGLSKNAFYTAQEKKDHIMWYKEYFESKKDLLIEVGAWDTKPNAEVAAN